MQRKQSGSKISRREFLNGTQVAIGASLLSPWIDAFGAPDSEKYYPPARTGLRGSHDGSWETMHARVAGQRWPAVKPGAHYDLVVVGAGISGLSAACFYARENPGARILILDNHDDFGGHAKRNEFSANGQRRITYGGTESIDTPSSYARVSTDLLTSLGIETERFYRYFDQELYDSMDLSYAIAFDEATYGEQRTVTGYGSRPWQEFVADTPLNEQARDDLLRAFTDKRDYLPGMSQSEKRELLSRISYRDFLQDYVKVDKQVLDMYQRWGMSYWCVGMDQVPAIAVLGYTDGGGLPGLDGTVERAIARGDEPYIFHFPDGNATIARLLVRQLVKGAVPGDTMEDCVTATVDYSKLDRDNQHTRIRLLSTVVNVEHAANQQSVNVTYVNKGNVDTVSAAHVVMACYNSAIPYLCPELSSRQRQGLAANVKIPLTYTKVLLRNWRPFAELGMRYVFFTNDFYKQIELDYPVSIGDYRFNSDPDQPMVLHMCYVPYVDDAEGKEQWRQGRRIMLGKPFADYEHHALDQIQQALAGSDFDVDRDVAAITVNRWPHGYSYGPGRLWHPQYDSEDEQPWVIGRQPLGRIHIANSDAGASADTDTAISQAYRAVREIVSE